jgi:hypothetical protein
VIESSISMEGMIVAEVLMSSSSPYLPHIHITSQTFKVSNLLGGLMSYPVLIPKQSTHSICAQESSLHIYHTENGYRITNVTIILFII